MVIIAAKKDIEIHLYFDLYDDVRKSAEKA